MTNAMSELSRAGAKGLPGKSIVAKAKDGTVWSGKRGNGNLWELIKHGENSYTCVC